MSGAPQTLAELAERAGIELAELHDFKEKDFDDLTVELGIPVTGWVRLGTFVERRSLGGGVL